MTRSITLGIGIYPSRVVRSRKEGEQGEEGIVGPLRGTAQAVVLLHLLDQPAHEVFLVDAA
jgi:hypothetical protein